MTDETKRMPSSRVCVICSDICDSGGNDLSGRFARIVIDELAKNSPDIDILITNLSRNSLNTAIDEKETARVKFLSEVYMPEIAGRDQASIALRVYRIVRDLGYASVHILLPGGTGAYCAMARRQGLIQTSIVTYLVDGSEAGRRQNAKFPDINDFTTEALERAQCENSDLLISLDGSMAPPAVKKRAEFEPPTATVRWPLRLGSGQDVPKTRDFQGPIQTIIVLGNHDHSCGLDLLTTALNSLPSELQANLLFIGDFGHIFGEHSGGYILRRLAIYAGEVSFLPPNCHETVAGALASLGSLAIIPGRGRKSGWEFAEIFSSGTPFLTFGIEEIHTHVPAQFAPYVVVDARPDAIADAIIRAATDGLRAVRAIYSAHEIEMGWKAALDLAPHACGAKAVHSEPLVSVCLTHYERPTLLRAALSALASQTYENIEVIVVDDGSRSSEALDLLDELEESAFRFPLTVVRSPNRYLGAARNLGAANATGEFLLFHDDDNIAEPNQVEAFVRAATASGADILTCLYWTFEGDWNGGGNRSKNLLCHAIGAGGAIALLENRFGDANALVRRKTFEEIGGFSDVYGVGYEDWEFFVKAYLRGYHISLVPEPLFNYRLSGDSMVASGNHQAGLDRVLRLLDKTPGPFAGDLARAVGREASLRHAAAQLSKALKNSNARSLHLQLSCLPSNAVEIWAYLSQIAEAEGRTDDPAKWMVGSHDGTPSDPSESRRRLGSTVFAEFPSGETSLAAMILGWAVSPDGAPISPSHFRWKGQVFEVCAIARHPRPDVNDRFKLHDAIHVGFCLAGRLVSGPKSWRYRFGGGSKVGTANGKMRFFGYGTRRMIAHIDRFMAAHEAHVAPPIDWNGRLAVEAAEPSFPFIDGTGNEYQLGTQMSPLRTEFIFQLDEPPTKPISIISPVSKQDLYFQIRNQDLER